MTTEGIREAIADIRGNEDCEALADVKESALRENFIRYVSTLDNPSLAEKAKLVLTAREMT